VKRRRSRQRRPQESKRGSGASNAAAATIICFDLFAGLFSLEATVAHDALLLSFRVSPAAAKPLNGVVTEKKTRSSLCLSTQQIEQLKGQRE